MLLRSPCKKFEPYDNPFWGFEYGYQEEEEKKKKKKITLNSGHLSADRWRSTSQTKIIKPEPP
jgi:hypothetical protein